MWASVPFVRFTLWLIFGILIDLFFEPNLQYGIILFGLSILIYGITLKKSQQIGQHERFSAVLGFIAFIVISTFGMALTDLNTPARQPEHILHFSDTMKYIEVTLNGDLRRTKKSFKVEAQISRFMAHDQWFATNSKLMIYFQQSPKFNDFRYGTRMIIKGSPRLILRSSNPNSFDYQQYLAHKGIYHQLYVRPFEVQEIGLYPANYAVQYALNIRRFCAQELSKYVQNARSAAIIKALILGIKDDIDDELREQYSSTGVMHILAVSGLHVGIILKIVEWIFGFLYLKNYRHKKYFLAIITTCILVFYALITGFSPSVVRAVVMFSCVIWSRVIGRKSNIYNTIAFSAFVMLCYDPYFLTQVGFQLSYLAVIGIIYFYPKFESLWYPSNFLMRMIWQILLVSVSAQIAVTPISLFYFKQFPIYFLVSNLLIIPLIPVLIQLGLVVLGLATLGTIFSPVAEVLGQLLHILIHGMNIVLKFMNELPLGVIENVSMTLFETVLLYMILVIFVGLLTFRKFWMVYALLIFSAFFCGLNGYKYYRFSSQRLVCIYDLKSPNIAFLDGHTATLIADSLMLQNKKQIKSQVLGHWQSRNIYRMKFVKYAKTQPLNCHYFVRFNRSIIVVYQHTKKRDFTMFPAADILLIDARYAYLFDVIDKHKYKKVIVTGINSYHNIEAFKKILRNKIKKLIFVEHDQYFEFML